jgi:hypothetical protein
MKIEKETGEKVYVDTKFEELVTDSSSILKGTPIEKVYDEVGGFGKEYYMFYCY